MRKEAYMNFFLNFFFKNAQKVSNYHCTMWVEGGGVTTEAGLSRAECTMHPIQNSCGRGVFQDTEV